MRKKTFSSRRKKTFSSRRKKTFNNRRKKPFSNRRKKPFSNRSRRKRVHGGAGSTPPPPPPPPARTPGSIPPPRAPGSTPASTSIPIPPLPFVVKEGKEQGKDLGENPIDEEIIIEFDKHDVQSERFIDVDEDINLFIYGENYRQQLATTGDEYEFKLGKWMEFQNEKLVPAVNAILSSTIPSSAGPLQVSPLAGPNRFVNGKSERLTSATNLGLGLSHLEIFATNLYTKEDPATPLQFYKAVNRYLLQLNEDKTYININHAEYNNYKKIFNVWLFLFLKGLHKLMKPVPKMYKSTLHKDNPAIQDTVRLYRGIDVSDDISNALWKSPNLDKIDPTLNIYYTLGFSSFTTDLQTSCKFFGRGSANFLIYEPHETKHTYEVEYQEDRKIVYSELYLPSLSSVSDMPNEDEFLTLPGRGFVVYRRDPENIHDDPINESIIFDEKCTNGVRARWIGLMDIAGPANIYMKANMSVTRSGGKRRNKITRKYKKN